MEFFCYTDLNLHVHMHGIYMHVYETYSLYFKYVIYYWDIDVKEKYDCQMSLWLRTAQA